MIIKDKDLVAQRLAAISASNGGRLTPDLVLADAQDSGSVLHDLFEWDNSTAAHQYRLSQARSIITSVRVVITTENRQISTVYYVRDPEAGPDEQGYVSLDRLKTDKDLAQESIVLEFSRASSYLKRAKTHAAALGMAGEVDVLIDSLEDFKHQFQV